MKSSKSRSVVNQQKMTSTQRFKHLSKSKKSPKNKSTVNNQRKKKDVKTSIEKGLQNANNELEFRNKSKYSHVLTQSTQEIEYNLFKNTEIQKSIDLEKVKSEKKILQTQQSKPINNQKVNSPRKRSQYYGDGDESPIKASKKRFYNHRSDTNSGKSKDSIKSTEKVFKKTYSKLTNPKKETKKPSHRSKSPQRNLCSQKSQLNFEKEQKRAHKLQTDFLEMLEERLDKKQSDYETLKIMNMLEIANAPKDELSSAETKRLKKIQQFEQERLMEQINCIKKEIQTVNHSHQAKLFDSNLDVSWI